MLMHDILFVTCDESLWWRWAFPNQKSRTMKCHTWLQPRRTRKTHHSPVDFAGGPVVRCDISTYRRRLASL